MLASVARWRIAIFAVSLAAAAAEDERGAATVVVEPGPRYHANWLYRFVFGTHWREEWTTPVRVPVLELRIFDGGVAPVRRGGGLQTMNLRLESAGGQIYAFRSVDKDPTRIFEPELRESVLGDIYQDMTSTSHPMAPLVVPRLVDAADVPHTTPQLMVMGDDPGLRQQFPEFVGILGMLEPRIEREYPGATKYADTLTLIERLERRTDERVDAVEYLRARLVDLLVGDWDRHIDQWRWMRMEVNGKKVWRAVPRDRDQAFSRFDGIVPSVAEYYVKQLAGFDSDYPSIEKLTFSGRFTDRRFLPVLDKKGWDAVSADVVPRLTDQAISEAVRQLPPEIYAKSGERLEQALRARRDRLSQASTDFYRLLADKVDIYGTIGADRAVIRRDGSTVEVSLFDERSGSTPYFHRVFNSDETSQIRLYLLGGGDRVEEQGSGDPIDVRIVRQYPYAEAPVTAERPGAEASQDSSDSADDPETAALRKRYEPLRDWGSDLLFFPQLSYDSTRGLVFGATAQWTQWAFQRAPYNRKMLFGAAFSTGTTQPRLEMNLDQVTGTPVHALLYFSYSGMDFVDYYGAGNDTVKVPNGNYRTRQKQLNVHPALEMPLVGPLWGRAGILLKHVSSLRGDPLTPTIVYGAGPMTLMSGDLGFTLDATGGALTRRRGFRFDVTGRYSPPWLDSTSGFGKFRGEALLLAGTDLLPQVLLSLRVAGEKNWGRYPFFESAFIGGAATRSPLDLTYTSIGNLLRGYDLNRFAGDASVVSNNELRIALGKYSALLPLRYGLLGLADVGRVFLAGESSKSWHLGAGGGLWLAMYAAGRGFEVVTSFSLAVVKSDESTGVYFLGGFGL
ncbi:MAG TPA: hypothetical protein VEP66_08080 [Myxococcales bacterium]|nr:hypothetical protein [Myxococcales bacterium]